MQNIKNILIAFDGSDQAMDAVRYVSRFFTPDKTRVHLFHVAVDAPEAVIDLRKDSEDRYTAVSISAWADTIKQNLTAAFTKAASVLEKAGFPESAVKSTYHRCNHGVARDIIAESRMDYDLLVFGRNGLSRLEHVVIGSVANKLLSAADHLPLIAVGGCPQADKILIGIDGSESSARAVDCICEIVGPQWDRMVTLCHVVRSLNLFLNTATVFDHDEEQTWLTESRYAVEPAIASAEQRLIDAGVHPGNIFKQVLENKASRASGLVRAAHADNYQTIVVGRRGLTFVPEFVMGRVSRKVLHMGGDIAVWVV